jgi:hypothetical protein
MSDDAYHIGRMNGTSPSGFSIPEPKPEISCFIDKEPGLTMRGAVVTRCENVDGSKYFKAVAQIGTMFGAEVDGEITGIGNTLEIAMERLAEERAKLYNSMFE